MQVTETTSDGLKREIQVILNASELNERRDKRIDEIKDQVQIKGFRKGKVPVAHLRKVYGRQFMVEVLEQAVEESSKQALSDRGERPAAQPKIELPEDQKEIETVIEGGADLSYSMSYEIIPAFELIDFATISLERFKVDVPEEEIDNAVNRLADENVTYEASETALADEGDKLKVDFVGRIDGEAFEGGTAEGVELVIGRGGFIPGFEEGLKGAKAGEERVVTATFPEAYNVEHLKGKEAQFEAKVIEVANPKKPEVNDEFAKSLGADDVAKLRELISGELGREYEFAARMKLKKELLDVLEERHEFELPPSLIETEFNSIWSQFTRQLEQKGETLEGQDKSEDELREEYQRVARRRVRLGLVIGEIGEKNKIEVTQDELRQALVNEARQYPGQEKHVYEFYEKTPGAIAQLRAPIFEDKAVDFILSAAQVTDKTVTLEELRAASTDADEDDDTQAAPGA